jgi:hypothetical protein
MQPEPVAQIVFRRLGCRGLGQDESWTDKQKLLLKELAAAATQSSIGTDAEQQAMADAIRRGLHRRSLRQGILRPGESERPPAS